MKLYLYINEIIFVDKYNKGVYRKKFLKVLV